VQAVHDGCDGLCEHAHHEAVDSPSSDGSDERGPPAASFVAIVSGRPPPSVAAAFVELPPLEVLRLSDAELRDYCDREDVAKGKMNGLVAPPGEQQRRQ
jgi:hypothetical protein